MKRVTSERTQGPLVHCETPIGYEERADGYGSVAVICLQSVGLTRWEDVTGRWHIACPRHVAARKHRCPEVEDAIDAAKAEAFR